ncbi:MAG: helix-turn-helix domain-containing protein [Candidatus Omnitrophica bacterium]|nr:helix-turn-helix domain-containing protein [Candidatus Omnitrophota bacterium]
MEKLWTTSEAAQYLGVSEADVEQFVRAGQLTGYKLGGKFLRFKPDQVKGLKASVTPRPQPTMVAPGGSSPWQERIRDFIYFYDFYILSALLLGGVVFYLMVSS